MSTNFRFYATKMAEQQKARVRSRPLQGQLEELMRFVHECETRWPIHDSQRAIDPQADR
jgi:hypothetical protein